MPKNLLLIKTIPHLIPVLTKQHGINVCVEGINPQLYKFAQNLDYYPQSLLTFTRLHELLELQDFVKVESCSGAGEFTQRGDTILFWPFGYELPLRASFFGDKLESLIEIDIELNRGLDKVAGVYLSKVELTDVADQNSLSLNIDHDSSDTELNIGFFTTAVPLSSDFFPELQIIDTDFTYPSLFWGRMDLLEREIDRYHSLGYLVTILTRNPDHLPARIIELTNQVIHPLSSFISTDLPAGFISSQAKLVVFTDREIFGTVYLSQRKQADDNTQKLLRQLEGEIKVGDFVVHEDYGIAQYTGLTQEMVGGIYQEYLFLQFLGEDSLLMPVDQVDKLTKYIGPEGIAPKLSRLSKAVWENTVAKTKAGIRILARELIEHYARRELSTAIVINSDDSPQYQKFIEKFTFTPTRDQLHATNEILNDLGKHKPMNRVLVGDVGFGKTEVMMRAAFKVVESGHQVAVLCPTTVLAAQHYKVFKDRFAEFGIRVEDLSRLQGKQTNQKLVVDLNQGEIDIIVGTHRLLSKDVKFAKLGLLIVDEEQRFGVKQKERIKQVNYGVHHLAVSATPIPRTLSMTLSTIQDVSLISQAPSGRKPITTEIVENDWSKIRQAINMEVSRGGQIYFIHNKISSINSVKAKLADLMPGLRVVIGHGQMIPAQLDSVMTDFYEQKYDVLLCTTIVENGLDMPNVNTIIIHQAQTFGLSQLYQLRGRVGRSPQQAYCYLLYTGRTEADVDTEHKGKQYNLAAWQRINAIAQNTELGSGFHIASRDLEIRGAGDLLGNQQHGHINKIGYAMYMELLAKEMERLKLAYKELERQPEFVTL